MSDELVDEPIVGVKAGDTVMFSQTGQAWSVIINDRIVLRYPHGDSADRGGDRGRAQRVDDRGPEVEQP